MPPDTQVSRSMTLVLPIPFSDNERLKDKAKRRALVTFSEKSVPRLIALLFDKRCDIFIIPFALREFL